MALRLYREAAAAAASNGNGGSTQDNARGGGGDGDGAAATAAEARNAGEASTSGSSTNPGSGSGPRRLIIELPLPSQRVGFLGRVGQAGVTVAAVQLPAGAHEAGASQADLVTLLDEGDYPGGEVQRFRVIRKLVDDMLDGYGAEFLGFLEDGADGVGLWAVGRDTSVVANVTNATVPSLVKLFDGGYGSRATQPGHTIIAINPQWTDAGSVGQPWQWGLRRRAAEVLDPEAWETVYSARVVRSSYGANGLLHRAWPHRWALYPAASPDARYLGDCLLATPGRPASEVIIQRLNEAKPEMQKKAKELGLDEPGWF